MLNTNTLGHVTRHISSKNIKLVYVCGYLYFGTNKRRRERYLNQIPRDEYENNTVSVFKPDTQRLNVGRHKKYGKVREG